MSPGLAFNDLLEYTDWERRDWFAWIPQQDRAVLEISTGPSGDGRFGSIGDLCRHIFSAELRYVERLSDRPITETSTIPSDNLDALFQLSQQSRLALRGYIAALPVGDWDQRVEFNLMNSLLVASPRKIVTHVLIHELRHWAQIATMLRLNGLKVGFHDLLFSPAMGGEFQLGHQT